jgi:hypothetical protein
VKRRPALCGRRSNDDEEEAAAAVEAAVSAVPAR